MKPDQTPMHRAGAPAPLVSIIIPVFNEEGSIARLIAELGLVCAGWANPVEIVVVNDGSTDATAAVLNRLVAQEPRLVVVHLRRNFGQTAALSAGIDHSKGEILVPMDGDLQNDPADVPRLVARLADGFDVVSGWRKDRQDPPLRSFVSRVANRLVSAVSGVRLHDYGCSLKAYRRDVVEGVRIYGEMHRFVPVYAWMQGGKVDELVVHHRPRTTGRSKYGFGRLYKVLLDLLLLKFLMSYMSKPIYVFGGFGLLCLGASLAPIGLAVAFKYSPLPEMQKDFVETPLPIMAAVLILVGCLAVLQGLLAELLTRTYYESQGKRPYLVREIRGREG